MQICQLLAAISLKIGREIVKISREIIIYQFNQFNSSKLFKIRQDLSQVLMI